MNFLTAQMELAVGLPGLFPRFPERKPPTVIRSDALTMNHIHIDRSNVGVVNTGTIGHVDTAIGKMQAAGEQAGADAFKLFTEGLVKIQGVDAGLKNQLIEILSVLAAEAALPSTQRRRSAMQPLLVQLATLTSGIADLAALYGHYGPALAALFTGV